MAYFPFSAVLRRRHLKSHLLPERTQQNAFSCIQEQDFKGIPFFKQSKSCEERAGLSSQPSNVVTLFPFFLPGLPSSSDWQLPEFPCWYHFPVPPLRRGNQRR